MPDRSSRRPGSTSLPTRPQTLLGPTSRQSATHSHFHIFSTAGRPPAVDSKSPHRQGRSPPVATKKSPPVVTEGENITAGGEESHHSWWTVTQGWTVTHVKELTLLTEPETRLKVGAWLQRDDPWVKLGRRLPPMWGTQSIIAPRAGHSRSSSSLAVYVHTSRGVLDVRQGGAALVELYSILLGSSTTSGSSITSRGNSCSPPDRSEPTRWRRSPTPEHHSRSPWAGKYPAGRKPSVAKSS